MNNFNYERLTAAIACGIRDGLRLAREEKRQEEQDIAVQKIIAKRKYENREAECDWCTNQVPQDQRFFVGTDRICNSCYTQHNARELK